MIDRPKPNIQTRKRGTDPSMPRLLGDRLCLDFANTLESPRGEPEEFLHSYADLVRWGRHVGILGDSEVKRLRHATGEQPGNAETVFKRAIALRTAITRVFRAIAAGKDPSPDDLAVLQAEYLIALEHTHLERQDDQFAWVWMDNDAIDRPLWDVARSAIAVLTQDDLRRVKECPGADDCGWLFFDTSKNASRRWCSMEGCGSRVKMRHQYARKRGMGGR
ncbi:MAG: ABATE domain-containing protein [Nitrolancea sp.]